MKWIVPEIWKGGECWIIGGGPSIVEQFNIPKDVVKRVRAGELPLSAYSPYLSSIHDRHVIGVNVAFMIGNWIDVLFFGDGKFYLKHREAIDNFPNLKVTCSGNFGPKYKNIKYLARTGNNKPRGLTGDKGKVCWNRNSGAAAINMAVHTGVKRIILLGFDMKLDDEKRQHWHDVYNKGIRDGSTHPPRLPFNKHLIGFDAIKQDALNMGVDIINANPNSAIKQFYRCNVKELL
jgi:hypothetical protein